VSISSLAVDSTGIAHIAYYDASATALRYAVQNGNFWDIDATLDNSADVGLFTSIALDNNDYPHIAYYDLTNTALKYVYWNGSDWIKLTPDNSAAVGEYISLDIDSSGNSHVSYYDATNNSIKYAYRTGNTWTSQPVTGLGTLSTISLLAPTSSGFLSTSLKLDQFDNPAIAFYHSGNQELQFARLDGVSWAISVVDTVGNVGQFASMDFNEHGSPSISYYDFSNLDLKLARGLIPSIFIPLIILDSD
jgi:hypothetical protein